MDRIYLDNAATTRVHDAVVKAMLPCFTQYYGNPSGAHAFSREATTLVRAARDAVQHAIGARYADEIVFTSGGSESDNLAIRGVLHASSARGRHVITTRIEHHAVLHTLEALQRDGLVEVSYLDVDRYGRVNPNDLFGLIRPDTVLVSVMFANNEVGTIEPIERIGEICKQHGIPFHTDAVQALGHVPLHVEAMHIDLMSLSAHKVHGPKGVGALYVKRHTPLHGIIFGGAQEKNKRAGTENVPAIVGFGEAARLVTESLSRNVERMRFLRDRLIDGILTAIPEARLNGHPTERLCSNAHLSIPGVRTELLLQLLDRNGIAASAGSACTAGAVNLSHVLAAMGADALDAASLRLSLSPDTTGAEIERVLDILPRLVRQLNH